MQKEILDLFKVMVVNEADFRRSALTDFIDYGLVLDFNPTSEQVFVLTDYFKKLDIRTLFTKEERDNTDPFYLITKQLLHYLEVYTLNTPGLFDLEVTEGQIITMNFIHGVTKKELGNMVRELLYSNAPVKDAETIKKIIAEMQIDIDINKVINNELRVALFDGKVAFDNGDDAVRYICYAATQNPMLIKSKEVIAAIKLINVPSIYLEQHTLPLAQVFNRHKRLILAAKKPHNRSVINYISHLSKSKHIPIQEHVSKRFISNAMEIWDDFEIANVLSKVTLRDKFKYLNLLEYKASQYDTDAFNIRNGKVFVKDNRPIYRLRRIQEVTEAILASIAEDLQNLYGNKILLDANVKYGLPISRKQTIGQLPLGTKVTIYQGNISSGIYWHNNGGAKDLDLSMINEEGHRTGWGSYSGYDQDNPIKFSGDITDARNGAMEFATSIDQNYGLFVNIYTGEPGCEMELVVGNNSKDRWINNTVIREKCTLNSKDNLIGFVRNHEFIVYAGRLGGRRVSSSGKNPLVTRGMSEFWTINSLFDVLDIFYDVDKDPKIDYDYDLTYTGFSYDKLENILLNN